MAQPSPAPAADDRGRSGSGDLRDGQIGQGSPALPGENNYNYSNLGNGKVNDETEENGDYGTRYSGDSRRNSLAGEQHGEPCDSQKLAPGVAGTDTVKPEQSVRAGVRDRQPVAALDSAIKPVQSQTVNENSQKPVQAEPVQADSLPTENKELTGNSPAACPDLHSWRQSGSQPPLPRYFTAVPHLRFDYSYADGSLTVKTETLTGWQIQWSTTCPICAKRFRPVAGFVPLRTVLRLKEIDENEQRKIITNIIRARFESGSVSDRHSDCTDRSGA